MLAVGDVSLVAGGVDEGVFVAVLEARVFLFHVEVAAVSAEEDVAGKILEDLKLVAVIGGDLGIGLVGDEFVAGVDVGAADDDDVKGATVFDFVEGPGGGAFGVAGGEVRGEGDAAEGDVIAVVEDAVNMRGREAHGFIGRVMEVGRATRLDDGNVLRHDVVFGAGETLDCCAAGAVVVVSVAYQEDFGVGELEAELFDALLDERRRRFKIAVDEDVASGRDDEVAGEISAANVIEIPSDVKGRERGGPIGRDLGGERECKKQCDE